MVRHIIKILMDRDGIEYEDAKAMVKECQRRLEDEAIQEGDYELATDIIADELGLEPDYIVDLLL